MSSLLAAFRDNERLKQDEMHIELDPGMLQALHSVIFGDDFADPGSRQMLAALETLTPREREILVRRSGLGESRAHLRQRFAVTQERIRQLERGAIKKCKQYAEALIALSE